METRAVIKFFSPLQGKAPKEIHAILTETLACFLPGWATDFSAPLLLYLLQWNCFTVNISKSFTICSLLIFSIESVYMNRRLVLDCAIYYIHYCKIL